MPVELLFRFLEFAVRTAILFGLLWVMIKLQKFGRRYEYRLLKLMGAAALASGLDMIPYAGHFLAVPVLLVSVKKVTHADYVEALFTIAISYALVFGVNRFLLGSLMGNLRTRVENTKAFEVITRPRVIKKAGQPTVISTNPAVLQTNLPVAQTNPSGPPTNLPVLQTNPPVLPTNPPAPRMATNPPKPDLVKPAPGTLPQTNPPAQTTNQTAHSAPTNAAPPPTAKPAENMAKYFSVKGVTRNGTNSAVTIRTGTKVYTVFLDEAALMQTPAGPISVRFAGLGTNSVTLEINGEAAKYQIR